jgi:hypothetical protein
MAELQAQYKDQGVTIISFTSCSIKGAPDNTPEKVATFLKERGPTLTYTFAYADDGTMADSWLAGSKYLPSFVVDKGGRIAYIGDPLFLGLALQIVVASGASPKAVADEMAKAVAEYHAMWDTLDRTRIDGRRDAQSLLNLADAHLISGDNGVAEKYARRALDAATGESSTFQESIEKEARRLGAER